MSRGPTGCLRGAPGATFQRGLVSARFVLLATIVSTVVPKAAAMEDLMEFAVGDDDEFRTEQPRHLRTDADANASAGNAWTIGGSYTSSGADSWSDDADASQSDSDTGSYDSPRSDSDMSAYSNSSSLGWAGGHASSVPRSDAGAPWDMEAVSSDTESVSRTGGSEMGGSDADSWSGPEQSLFVGSDADDEGSYADLVLRNGGVDRGGFNSLYEAPPGGPLIQPLIQPLAEPLAQVPGCVAAPLLRPLHIPRSVATVASTAPLPQQPRLVATRTPPAPPSLSGSASAAYPAPRAGKSTFGKARVSPKPKNPVERTEMKSPGQCPLCSRPAYCDLQDAAHLEPAAGSQGDLPTGRCKARDKPRKDNRLGMWYRKYGYDGQPYCKACSESFKSHLVQQKTRPRCGCVRSEPCGDCTKVLNGFSGMSHADVFHKFDAEKSSRASAAPKGSGKRNSDKFDSKGGQRTKKTRKALAGACASVLFVTAVALYGRSAGMAIDPSPAASSDSGSLTRCVDDEAARAAANPFGLQLQESIDMPFSQSCVEIARNGYCNLEDYINLGVRDFCCNSCRTVDPVFVCPRAADVFLQNIVLTKEPGVEIPLNTGHGLQDTTKFRFCSSAPGADTIPCSVMGADSASQELCFACSAMQAQLHGARCDGPEIGDVPYGWTCRCDGCAVVNSGECVTPAYMQQSIDDYERAMESTGHTTSNPPQVDSHLIGDGDINSGGPARPQPTSGDPPAPPARTQPGSTDPNHDNAAIGPSFTWGAIEPPQGEIKMPGTGQRRVPLQRVLTVLLTLYCARLAFCVRAGGWI
jgi:hypothetical protein